MVALLILLLLAGSVQADWINRTPRMGGGQRGLVLHLDFNIGETTVFKDNSEYVFEAVNTGATLVRHGFQNGTDCLYFNNDVLTIAHNGALTIDATRTFTFVVWAKFTNFTGSPCLIGKRNGTGAPSNYQIQVDSSGHPQVSWYYSGWRNALDTGDAISTGTWCMLGYVVNGLSGADCIFYIDGLHSSTISMPASLVANVYAVTIGRLASANQDLVGSMASVSVYNYGLSAFEMYELYIKGK